ncbi:MAG: hypothetical protein R2880_18075 [Deinococcales bacterium]
MLWFWSARATPQPALDILPKLDTSYLGGDFMEESTHEEGMQQEASEVAEATESSEETTSEAESTEESAEEAEGGETEGNS